MRNTVAKRIRKQTVKDTPGVEPKVRRNMYRRNKRDYLRGLNG